MVSCTEFIPFYSELFKFIEQKAGHDGVMRYWIGIADDSVEKGPNSLGDFVDKEGFEGCWSYWQHTLNEEAADFVRVYDVDKKDITMEMRHCPSKGLLLALPQMEPYYDYCGHCDVLYKRVLERRGIRCDMDLSACDRAQCTSHVYRENPEPCAHPTGEVRRYEVRASDNKYLHRDFHTGGDNGLIYVGRHYGDNGVKELVRAFAKAYYKPLAEDFQKRGLIALREQLEKVYAAEEMPEVLHTELSDDELSVRIDKCPAVTYFKKLGHTPSKWYIELTRTVDETIADMCGLGFELQSYDDATGAAAYRYFRRCF